MGRKRLITMLVAADAVASIKTQGRFEMLLNITALMLIAGCLV